MDNFLGQLALASFSFPPKGWAFCNGQLLPIAQNQALFSLIGTAFGGNGSSTFGLPNLQGRTPVGVSSANPLGSSLGSESATLTTSQMPLHMHQLVVSSANGPLVAQITGNTLPVATTGSPYATSADNVMQSASLSLTGSGAGHENRSPYVVLNWIIALTGIFPSRN